MRDVFKFLNVPKQRCFYCAPFGGENYGLRPLKSKARRRARHALKQSLKSNMEEILV